jgi:hypothetical protein
VSMVGCLGDDGYGRELRRALRTDGVGVRHVRRVAAPTGVALIVVGPDGENLIAVASGANSLVTPDDVSAARARLERADVIVAQLEVPLGVGDGGGTARGRALRAERGAMQVLSNELLGRERARGERSELAMRVGRAWPRATRLRRRRRFGLQGRKSLVTLGGRALAISATGTSAVEAFAVEPGRYHGRWRRVRRGACGSLSRTGNAHGCRPLRLGGGRPGLYAARCPAVATNARGGRATPRDLVHVERAGIGRHARDRAVGVEGAIG